MGFEILGLGFKHLKGHIERLKSASKNLNVCHEDTKEQEDVGIIESVLKLEMPKCIICHITWLFGMKTKLITRGDSFVTTVVRYCHPV